MGDGKNQYCLTRLTEVGAFLEKEMREPQEVGSQRGDSFSKKGVLAKCCHWPDRESNLGEGN